MKTSTKKPCILQICMSTLLLIAMSIPCYAIDLNNMTSVGNPAFAYSVRKLIGTYIGPAMRVRSGDNNAVVDVYFDTNNIVSLTSPVSADGGGAATSKTLGTWIGSNTAFVTKWHDQSGNNRDAATVGTKCKNINSVLTTSNMSTEGTLTNALSVKKYSVSIVDAVINSDSITISSIPTVSAGNTGGSGGVAVTTSYPSASGKWWNFNNIIVGDGIPEGTIIMGTTQFASTVTENIKVRLSNKVTLGSGAILTMYDNGGYNYQPGSVMVSISGYYIGTIQSIGDDGKSITFTNNAIIDGTFAANTWGSSNEPVLVKQGILQTFENGMTAIRFVNGGIGGSGLVIPSFTNDGPSGANLNLQNINNMSVFISAQQKGNCSNINALFCTNSPTSSTPGRLQVYIAGGGNATGAYSTQAGGSINFAAGTQMLTRYKILSDSLTVFAPIGALSTSARGKKGIFSSTGNPSVTTPLDNSQIQIFGHTGHLSRSFEGLASELIYWGSTITNVGEMSDADALLLQISQKEVYGVKEFVSAVKTLSDLPAKVFPTIGNGVFKIEGECVGANYTVVNLMGQLIKNGKIQETSQVVDLTKNASGTYLVKLSLNNRMVVKKILKL